MNAKNVISFLVLSLLLVSCGGSGRKFVSDLDVKTVDDNDQKWVVTNFKLDIGNVEVPDLVYPLPNDYGNFRAYRQEDQNYLGVDFNLTSILNLPGSIATLPNGQVVPVDTSGAGIIEIPVNRINGKAYVAVADGMALLGIAVVIKQLGDLDLNVGDVGVFPTYKIKGVDIMAGIFTSNDDQSNGIAIFANLASIWDGNKIHNPDVFIYEPEYVKRSHKRKILRKLQRMLKQKMKIEFM